ncbi:MAG: chemotaxis protein CheB [Mariprofundus sp.]|nr:chemotaxis protein CheB [Mariprofundus sp.]
MISKLNVVVVEGAPKARLAMVHALNKQVGINVNGIASDVMQARMQVKIRKPDVLVLGVNQNSDAITTFLMQMTEEKSLAMVIVTSDALPKSSAYLNAISSCIATMMVKPSLETTTQQTTFFNKLTRRIQRVSQQFIQKYGPAVKTRIAIEQPAKMPLSSSEKNIATTVRHHPTQDKLIALGASTGGTEALRHVIAKFPADTGAVVLVQHIPTSFSASFIDRLDQSSPMHVVSAEEGMEICKGFIYVGAGDEHFTIERNGQGYICHVGGKDPINSHCPSVDMLFNSVAKHAGSKAIGALMTGMGEDGASGLKKMLQSSARTVAQDKASSVVWGMPGAAVKIGAAEEEVALNALGDHLISLCK